MSEEGYRSMMDEAPEDADILNSIPAEEEVAEPAEIVRRALEEYISLNGDQLFFLKDIGLIVNDRNRPTPTSIVLEHLVARFPKICDRISRVHIATGTHKPPTEEDISTILGATHSTLKDKVHIHISENEEAHCHFCTTSRGTDVRLDRAVFDHEVLIMINSVEPHYFAGYTGGRKSLLPGMAWFGTVEMNHSHALDPGSMTLALEGNPVHEDMMEAVNVFLEGRKNLTFQLVQGPGKVLTSMVIGDMREAFVSAVDLAAEQFCIPVPGKYDVVISFAKPPMDRTLYQAQKAIENGKVALKEGGTMILAATCEEGIGKPAFWDLLTSEDDPGSVLDSIRRGYKLGYHKAAKIANLSKTADIFMVSDIPAEVLSRGFIRGFSSLEEAVKEARSIHGEDAKFLLIPDGTMTVPQPGE